MAFVDVSLRSDFGEVFFLVRSLSMGMYFPESISMLSPILNQCLKIIIAPLSLRWGLDFGCSQVKLFLGKNRINNSTGRKDKRDFHYTIIALAAYKLNHNERLLTSHSCA